MRIDAPLAVYAAGRAAVAIRLGSYAAKMAAYTEIEGLMPHVSQHKIGSMA